MKLTHGRVHGRLSLLVLIMMLASAFLAACGATPATNPSAPGAGPTAAAGTTPATDAAPTEDAGGGTGAGATETTAPEVGVTETAAEPGETAPAEETVGADETVGAEETVGATETVAEPGETVEAGETAPAEETPSATVTTGTGASAPGTSGQGDDCGVSGTQPNVEAVADANPNGELVFNLGGEPENGDPQKSSFVNEIQFNSLVFTPLIGLDREQKPVYYGAESCTVADGGKTYTFKVRQGITYSDGQALNARNYAYSILRSCDPDVAGQYAYVMYDIVGCQEYSTAYGDDPENPTTLTDQQKQQLRSAVGVRAVDDQTLEVKLKNPVGYFLYIMALWTTYPSREDLVTRGGDRWWTKPETFIGNGPFKLASYTPKQRIVFERNDTFFLGKPRLARITFELISSTQRALQAYQRGATDVENISSSSLPAVTGNPQLKGQLKREPEAFTGYLAFDHTFEPFKKVEVRQAFAYAVNRELFIRQINNGVGTPAGSFLPPGVAGEQEEAKQAYDPNRARQLLAQGGYPNGQGFPTIKFPYVGDDEDSRKRAVFWQGQFKKELNVNVEPTPFDQTEIVRLRKSNKAAERPDLYGSGWFQDYPHPQNWMSLVFTPGTENAPLGWKNDEYTQLVQRADKILSIDEAAPLYSQADQILANDAVVAFTTHGEVLALIKPYVKGFVSYPGDVIGFSRSAETVYVTNEKR